MMLFIDSFGVEHIPKEIKQFIDSSLHNKNIKANIFRIQAYDSIMCGYFCIGFIDLLKNDNIILNYFYG